MQIQTNKRLRHFGVEMARQALGATLTGLLLLIVPPAYGAPEEPESSAFKKIDVQTSARQSNIVLEFSKPLGNTIRTFSTVDPARLIIDLPPVKNLSGKSVFESLSPDVRGVSLVQSDSKTRVVMSLRQPMDAEVVAKGNSLVVQLRPVNGGSVDSRAGEPVVRASTLSGLDFRRGKEGEGRIVMDFSGTDIRPEVRTESGQLVVDLQSSGIADGLQKMLDVGDFGTPVKTIATRQTGNGTQIKIETNGYWEHSSYQENRRLILDLRPMSSDPSRSALLSKNKQFRGERISLNFQNADIRALLQVFAEFTNLNIIASDSVTGNATLRLKNVPWDQAMDIVLKSKGLDIRQTGNVMLVAPAAELAQREQSDLQAKSQLSDLEPLRLESFSLNYQKADDVVALITNDRQRLLSRRGSAVRDARTNQVFVQDVPAQLDQIRKLVSRLDVPVRQVMIEARVVIAESTFGSALGAKLGIADLRGVAANGSTGSKIPGTGMYSTIGAKTAAIASTTGQLGVPEVPAAATTNLVNLPVNSVNGFAASSVALSLFNSKLTQFINLELNALEADGKGKVISSPRVITADQVKALIEQGTEFPYNSASSSGATAVSFRKANLKLEVTPQITPEGGVTLDVDITKDAKGEVVQAGVAINTKHVQTKVLVENGGTVVIGGIFEQEDRDDVAKTPLLGDIPYLGNLFKTTTRSSQKRELMVFLTPRILASQSSR
ncbi:MAG: type IV pilus secretin PilQ [Burkholderiaceae bacterium]